MTYSVGCALKNPMLNMVGRWARLVGTAMAVQEEIRRPSPGIARNRGGDRAARARPGPTPLRWPRGHAPRLGPVVHQPAGRTGLPVGSAAGRDRPVPGDLGLEVAEADPLQPPVQVHLGDRD